MEVADLPNDKKKITITIAYNRFTVLSSEDEAYSRTLAEEVDRSIRELNSRITGDFNEAITGAKTIKSLTIEERMAKDL